MGRFHDPGQFVGGKFESPLAIAADGYGRVFVSDGGYIQVFDSSGKYLNNISGSFYGMTFDAQNNLYATSVSDTNVVKFQVQAAGFQDYGTRGSSAGIL